MLGYSEAEVWEMTLGKLSAMYHEYRVEHGLIEKKATIDDAIPF